MKFPDWSIKLNKDYLWMYPEMFLLFGFLQKDGIAKYPIFIVYMIYKVYRKGLKLNAKFWIPMIPTLFCLIYGLTASLFHTMNMETLKDACFLAIPIAGACLFVNEGNPKKRSSYINALFLATGTWFLIIGHREYGNSALLMESAYAFIFGIFLLYYIYRGNLALAILALLVFISADKRIAIGGAMLGLAVMALLFRKNTDEVLCDKNAILFVRVAGILTVFFLLVYVALCKYQIIGDIMDALHINSQGRVNAWKNVNNTYEFSLYYQGLGLGAVKNVLNKWDNVYFSRLHNDMLVYYIELGFIGFAVFIYLHFEVIVMLIRRRLVNYRSMATILAFFIYTFICYCTDNISIYIIYVFPFYLILGNVIYERV